MDRKKKFRAGRWFFLALLLAAVLSIPVSGTAVSAKKENTGTVQKKGKSKKQKRVIRAKSLKLKKKVTIQAGSSKKLKVKVKPKKATLKWKSNKKKIATVSRKGLVKGKKKGTAKITVSSGKKKAACKVTVRTKAKTQTQTKTAAETRPKVPEAFGIQKVEVLNPKVIRVTLNQMEKLNGTDFAVEKRAVSGSVNPKKLTITSVNNSGNQVYDLILATDYDAEEDLNRIEDADYVKVTVAALNGVNTGETVWYDSTVSKNRYIEGMTGSIIKEDVYFGGTYKGYLSGITVSDLPAGLTAETHVKNVTDENTSVVTQIQYVTVKGIPTQAVNGAQATMTAQDEAGRTLTQKILFYIGSDKKIVSYIEDRGRTILANDDQQEGYEIHVVGGSGEYQYSLVNNTNPYISIGSLYPDTIYFDSYIEEEDGSKQYLPVGEYQVSYEVTDVKQENLKSTGSLSVTAVNGIKIRGNVVAGDQTAVGSAKVYVSLRDPEDIYYLHSKVVFTKYADNTEDGHTYSIGDYEMVVYPSQTYDMMVECNGAKTGVSGYNPGSTGGTRNFMLPLYKISFQSDERDLTEEAFVVNSADQEYKKNRGEDSIYLKPDHYHIDTTITVSNETAFMQSTADYHLTASFQVVGNMTVPVAAAMVEGTQHTINQISGNLTEGTETLIQTNIPDQTGWEYAYYTFTPSTSGIYNIISDSFLSGIVYDSDRNDLDHFSAEKDEAAGNYRAYGIRLQQGMQYVLCFRQSCNITILPIE